MSTEEVTNYNGDDQSDQPRPSKQEPIVAKEVAEQEFERFVDAMDLDLEEADMDSEDLADFKKRQRIVLRAIEKGSLVINSNGEAVYTPQNENTKVKKALTFHERSGASMMATDGKKKNAQFHRTYSAMAEMCKVHTSVFSGMVGVDIKVSEALFVLLMG